MNPVGGVIGRKSKYRNLLQDEDALRWYLNLKRRSKLTANVYLRRLGNFCEQNNLTPKQLVQMSEESITNLILDLVTRLQEEGKTGSYAESIVKAIKSWLKKNKKSLGDVYIEGADETPTLKDETVPTPEELLKVLTVADLDAKVCICLIAHAGVRPETIGNSDGTDGLQLGDFPEVIIDNENRTVKFEKVPTFLKVRRSISKNRRAYMTLVGEEAVRYLTEYLEFRMRAGEKLTPRSSLVVPKFARKQFVATNNVCDKIRKAIRAAGFPWRSYIFRSYFDSQLLTAEARRLIIRDFRVFFMGHAGDIERTYTLNKDHLPESMIDEMRDAYLRCQPLLQSYGESTKRDNLPTLVRKQLLLVAGYGQEEVDAVKLDELTDEEMKQKLKERLFGGALANVNHQQVIQTSELEAYINRGWEFVGQVGDKIVVKLSG
jgi:hypothetical protein